MHVLPVVGIEASSSESGIVGGTRVFHAQAISSNDRQRIHQILWRTLAIPVEYDGRNRSDAGSGEHRDAPLCIDREPRTVAVPIPPHAEAPSSRITESRSLAGADDQRSSHEHRRGPRPV